VVSDPHRGIGPDCGCILTPLVPLGYLAFWAGVLVITVLVVVGVFLFLLARELVRAAWGAWARRKARTDPPESPVVDRR
jgi:hypothetical protein